MLDPIAGIVPSHHFMHGIQAWLSRDRSWATKEVATRVANLFAASATALLSCIMYVAAVAVTAIITPIKLPFSLLHLIFDENKFLQSIHDKIPGITDLMRNILKATLYALTILFATPLGAAHPKTLVKIHTKLDLSNVSL